MVKVEVAPEGSKQTILLENQTPNTPQYKTELGGDRTPEERFRQIGKFVAAMTPKVCPTEIDGDLGIESTASVRFSERGKGLPATLTMTTQEEDTDTGLRLRSVKLTGTIPELDSPVVVEISADKVAETPEALQALSLIERGILSAERQGYLSDGVSAADALAELWVP